MTKSRTTLETLEEFLQKTRRRLSDENPDYYEQDDEKPDPDSDMYSETEEPDEAAKWLEEKNKKEVDQVPEVPGEQKVEKPVLAPKQVDARSDDELQPTREELAGMREYTRPWEQRARDKAKLEAQAHVNPGKHKQGRIVEARNTSHADRQKAYEDFTNSPDFQNADPISQMEMEGKFHEDWHKNNPEHLINALTAHHEAHKKGDEAKDLFNQAKDEKIRHIAGGGAQPGAYSTEEGMQHAGGSREDEDSSPGGISQDKGAAFASGNQEFLQQYMKNYDNKAKKFSNVTDMDTYDPETRANVENVLGEHPALKDASKKKKVNSFVEKYHPLIGKAARRVLAKLGLTEKANRGEIDPGLLHEAGVHALFQAVNDYDHDHPSKAKFATHLNRKMHGLMQTALKAQDEIPEELRAGAKSFDKQRRASLASPVKHTNKEGVTTIINPAGAAPVSPKRSSTDIASGHSPEVQDRLKRVVAAKSPVVRKQSTLQPKLPAAPAKKWNINNVPAETEGGEE